MIGSLIEACRDFANDAATGPFVYGYHIATNQSAAGDPKLI